MAEVNFFLLALPFLSLTLAQQDLPASRNTATPTSAASTSSTDMPSPSDHASDNQTNPSRTDTLGLVNYYIVFVVFILFAAFLATFFMYRRKRKYGAIMSRRRETPSESNANTWGPTRTRRRYWQGRWTSSSEVNRDEGLNEQGEAPPPYAAKAEAEEAGGRVGAHVPVVPLQTLAREQTGLKPPDYTAVDSQPTEGDGTPTAGAARISEHAISLEGWRASTLK